MASAVRARPAAGPRRAEAVEDALAAAKAQLKEAERQWARVADFAGQYAAPPRPPAAFVAWLIQRSSQVFPPRAALNHQEPAAH